MASSVRLVLRSHRSILFSEPNKTIRFDFSRNCSSSETSEPTKREFRVIEILPQNKTVEKVKKIVKEAKPPRTELMSTDQDWTNVWPGPKTFHPASVPLPLRQGYNKYGPPLEKFANTELMKIPNFLHLTPPAIKKYCEALKKFCTEWPESLETDKDIEKHFPVEVITSDYCYSSPSIRHPSSRIVNIRIKLKNLNLNQHAKDKFLRLVGKRYDPETDYVTITTDSCPLKKQNYNYAQYLITALYYESWKFEDWEKLKGPEDMETYIFSERQSYENVKQLFDYQKQPVPDVSEFGSAVESWLNNGDSEATIENYKKASLKLLALPESL